MQRKPARKLNQHNLEGINARAKCLRKMGVSEDDVKRAKHLFAQMIPLLPGDMTSNKPEQIFGYATPRLKREKALKILGTSEDEVELENSKNLGALGIGGRRRSFCIGLGRSSVDSHVTKSRTHTLSASGRKALYLMTSHAKARRRLSSFKGNKTIARRHSTGEVFLMKNRKYSKSFIFPATLSELKASKMKHV